MFEYSLLRLILKRLLKLLPRRFEQQTDAFVEDVDAKDEEEETSIDDDSGIDIELSTERYAELAAKEEVILTVASNGQGKRTSSYEYRLTNRGGKGVISIMLAKSNADVVSSFPVDQSDQIMAMHDAYNIFLIED